MRSTLALLSLSALVSYASAYTAYMSSDCSADPIYTGTVQPNTCQWLEYTRGPAEVRQYKSVLLCPQLGYVSSAYAATNQQIQNCDAVSTGSAAIGLSVWGGNGCECRTAPDSSWIGGIWYRAATV